MKELWSEEEEVPEVTINYQYDLELRERLDETMKLAEAELEKKKKKNKEETKTCTIGKQRNGVSRREKKPWCYFPQTKTSFLFNRKVRLKSREPNGEQLPGRSQREGENVTHQHVEALCGER